MKVSGFTQNGSKGKVFMGWAADLWNLPKSTVSAPNLRDFRTGRGSSWKRSLLRTEPIEQLGVEKGSRLKEKCHIHVPVNTITWERLDGPWSWSDVQSDVCPSSGQCQLYSWGESTKKLPAPLERSELFCLHRYLKTHQAALGSQKSSNTSGRDVQDRSPSCKSFPGGFFPLTGRCQLSLLVVFLKWRF